MILGVGIDLVEIDRFRRTLHRRPGLIDRLFTEGEREYAAGRADPAERLAARFAAKEAALKSMGVGIGAVGWHDLEIRRDEDGRPTLAIGGRAAALADSLGIIRFELSITHTGSLAQAEVIAIGGPGRRRMSQWRADGSIAARRPMAAGARPADVDPLIAGELVPIVTPEQMRAIDAEAPEPVEELIGRAGAAIARRAVTMMGGTYGRRVVVLAGKGNNGADGRDAARRLGRRGVRVTVIDAAGSGGDPDSPAPVGLPGCDLVIDAAYGTGFRGTFEAPVPPAGAMVLAVDIPSGVDASTGNATGRVMAADETLTFAAIKPGLLFGDGAEAAGVVTVADIGLDVSRASAHLLGATAVARWLPQRSTSMHKWSTAVCVIAGGPGMGGAASLTSRAALRAGAGYVRLAMPVGTDGGSTDVQLPTEVVTVQLPAERWASTVLDDLDRFRALVIGNGLGLAPTTIDSTLEVLAAATERGMPIVVDADALTALAGAGIGSAATPGLIGANCVLTPHDGEFTRLMGGTPPGPDRIAAARELARRSGAIALLKGSTTVIASPTGEVLVSSSGDARLATAGTGDVLAGIIGALMASGLDAFHAAAAGAFIHGRAGALGWRSGSVAGDLPWRIPGVRDELTALLPRS